jgi:nicotinamide riboside transporter PnuC
MRQLISKNHIFEYHSERNGNKKSTNVRLISNKGWVFIIAFAIIATILIIGIVMARHVAN